MSDPRYPIGTFQAGGPMTPEERAPLLQQIEDAPANLRSAVADLDDAQLDTPYRDGGWTVRQLVHHVADSHMNAYLRLRWALTEDGPTVKGYEEKDWANLPDASTAPIEMSLNLLDALHVRWMALWRALTEEQFAREWKGPDFGFVPVDDLVRLYAWHGRHHAAHVTALREERGW
jgi:uncharacterized damage-inducible protein DinB